MSTYTDAAYAALRKASKPVSARSLYQDNDAFESAEQAAKAIAYLIKTGRAKVVGTEKPKGSKPIRLYRALTDSNIERNTPDLDQQLAEAIRERDAELAEAVIEPVEAITPIIAGDAWQQLVVDDERPSGLRYETKPNADPALNAIERLARRAGQIQGAREDAVFLRHLSAWAESVECDVAARLSLIAEKLEARA